jgi:2-aminoadipate transaminase
MHMPFATRMENIRPSAIRELLRLGAEPNVISFGGGYPDMSYFVAASRKFWHQGCAWAGQLLHTHVATQHK